MARVIRLLAGNLAVLLLLLLGIDLAVALYLDIEDWWNDKFPSRDERIDLPNFTDKAWSEQVFLETKGLEIQYAPFFAWSRGESTGKAVNVDADGDRTHPATTDSPVGVVRFFGGSTTWGTGVDDLHTIPALVNAARPEWRVHNHGEAGFVSRQELARLVSLVSVGAPMDLVVFYDGYNDVRNLCRRDVELAGHGRQVLFAARIEPTVYTIQALAGALQALILDVKKKTRRHFEPSRCMDDPDHADRVAEVLLRNWRMARAVAREGGADFVAVLQPVAAIGSPNLSHLAEDAFSLDDYAKLADQNNKLAQGIDHRTVYPRIQKRIREAEVDWILDLTDAFDGDEYIYMGPAHVTRNGNQRIANRLDVALDARLAAILARRGAAPAQLGTIGSTSGGSSL